MLARIVDISGTVFDYIIVGGGTAGLALAARLTEDISLRVVVLEAGEANLDDPMNLLPMQAVRQFNNPKYDWTYKTVGQPYSNDREYVWYRERGLGGSSALNFMFWNKPARQYIDAFEELGNKGWNWDVFHKYVKKAEKFTPPVNDGKYITYDERNLGSDGPVDISFSPSRTHLEEPLLEAMKQHGIPQNFDTSYGLTHGASTTPASINPRTFYRSHSANTYYQPRANLSVLVGAHVTGILSRPNADGTITATGVTFMHEETEVILAAGAVASPQILELSGIGGQGVLQKAGVKVKVDLAGVGENVQEHLWFGLVCQLNNSKYDGHEIETCDPLFFPELSAEHWDMRALLKE
ncbi:glucose-methanol-choline oxidoreductase [Fomitopsis betulina]|nr:glucose-methanol-choline oxidoreductase [Fomitopsis betulina]